MSHVSCTTLISHPNNEPGPPKARPAPPEVGPGLLACGVQQDMMCYDVQGRLGEMQEMWALFDMDGDGGMLLQVGAGHGAGTSRQGAGTGAGRGDAQGPLYVCRVVLAACSAPGGPA